MKVWKTVQQVWQVLSRRERRIVRSFAKGSPDAVLRCRSKVVLALVQGNQPVKIAETGLASQSQVYRVIQRFREGRLAGLVDRREDNGDSPITWHYETMLCDVVAGSPQEYGHRRPTWTQELLLKVLKKLTGIRISVTTMSRLLRRLGIRLGRPKPIVGCPWSKAQKTRRLNKIRQLIATAGQGDVIVYEDEVDVHLNPKIGPDWMLPSTQKTVMTPGKNQKRYLAGALNVKTGQLSWVEGQRKTSSLFLTFLWHLLQQVYQTAKRIYVILDNYRIHSSRQVELAMANMGGRIQLVFLPPYCPDNNRIERTWRDLHANVTRNHRCRTMGQLMAEVRRYLKRKDRRLQRLYTQREDA
jgi:transposase